jgi:hypothetical protein
MHLPKLAAAVNLQRRLNENWKSRRASTIARSEEAPSPTRLCESINKPAARSEAHITVARRPGNIPVLSWTKNRRIPSTKLGKDDRSTTSGPTSSLQSIHLGPAPSAIVDIYKRQRHVEKQISLDLKNNEKTKLSI